MSAHGDDARAEAIDRKLGDYSVYFLIIIAGWLLISPLVPVWSGFNALVHLFGSEQALLRFFVAFLFLYFAGIVKDKNALRFTVAGMVRLIREHVGKKPPTGLDAIDILIESLGKGGNPETRSKIIARLADMTGQGFGDDTAGWQRWWASERSRLEAKE